MSELNNASLADRLESFIPNGDGHNSDYANTLADAVEALRGMPALPEGYALSEFKEGQWWVAELDAVATKHGAPDNLKRAVAVVHAMLAAAKEGNI